MRASHGGGGTMWAAVAAPAKDAMRMAAAAALREREHLGLLWFKNFKALVELVDMDGQFFNLFHKSLD